MGLLAFSIIVVLALVAGFAVQYFVKRPIGNEWLIVALAAAFGAYFASETLPGSTLTEAIKDWGPQLDGMVVIPAIVGAIVLALIADFGVRTGSATLPST
jgi:uncharacterized membrane protein YeaQ/YmgE (transglycosylase-associated protein family)